MITVTRWLVALLIAVFAVVSTGDAEAQAFKPKKGQAKGGGTAAKKAPAPAKKGGTAPRRVVTSKAAPKKKGSRAAQTGRTEDLTPDADSPKSKSSTQDDDYVVIEDDDE